MKKNILLCITAISMLLFSNVSFSQTLELGTLDSFGAFSGTGGIANSGQIEGDTGTYNGIFSGNGSNSGQQYPSGSPISAQAQKDVLRVYIHLSDVFVTQPSTHPLVFGSGETIYPGVYSMPGAGAINGTLTLDGNGNSDSVFILKWEGALTVGASATIVLSNGTKAANVYWISEGAITLGANSVVRGSVFAHPGGITVGANGTIEGRLITSEGAISVGAGGSLVIPVGPSDIQINCLGTCDSNPNVDILGSVKDFAMFTSSGAVSNAATSGFVGDIGTNAGAITGIQTGATTHIGDRYPPGLVSAQASQDLSSAYNQLMAIQNTQLGHIPAFGNGEAMQPGVYYIAGAGSLQGTIVLDANFDPDAVFIFKFLGALTVYAQSKVILKNGARRCNVFWVSGAGGSAAIDIGTFAFIKGTFLAHGGACTAGANVNLEGRMLSTAGAIGFSTGVIYNDTLCFEDEIAIVKTGLFLDMNEDQCADSGETIDYTFTVTNEGNESLSAIVVTDPLVPVITYVSGDTNGDLLLDVTETWIYTGAYTLVQSDIVAKQVTNQALASAITYNGFLITDLSGATINDDDPTVTDILCRKIALIKEGDLNVLVGDCAVAGDTIDYTFTVTNQGDEGLSAINVTDPLVPIITYVSGDTNGDLLLDVTETWIYTGTYTLVQADIVAGLVINQATVVGTGSDNTTVVTDFSDDNSVLENDPTVNYTCPIAIVKEGTLNVSDGDCAVAGDTIEYTFTVTNQANEILSAINVTDPLVPIITYVSGDTNGDLLLDLMEVWIHTGTYILVQADIVAGLVTNQATVVGTQPDGTSVTDFSDDNSVLENDPTVNYTCPIAIVKEGTLNVSDGDCAVAGDTIEYTFTVTNQANEILSAIVVTDLLVPVITYVSGDTNGDLLLDVTETWIYTGTYILVQADIVAGLVTNQATVVGTQPDGTSVTDFSDDNSVLENDPTVNYTCPIAIVKEGTLNVSDGDCAVAGDTIEYTFTVTNQANEILSAIVVTDLLVPVITYVSGDTNGDLLLDVTETWIYTGTYILVQADIVAGLVTNQATVVGTQPDGTSVTDFSDDNSVLENDPTVNYTCPIAIVKEGTLNVSDGDCAVAGDTIEYTFTVTNQANEILSAIVVTDLLVPVITYVSGDTNGDLLLDVTETWIYTGTYILVQADIVAGLVTNQATVVGTQPDGTSVTDFSDDNSVLENDPTVNYTCPIAIVKEGTLNVSDGDCAVAGDTIEYTFTVTNQANEILSAIVVTDLLVPVITYVSGDTNGDLLLDVTETWIYTGTYILVQADIVAGLVTNQATVVGTQPDGTSVTDFSDDNSVLENDPTVNYTCPIAIVKEGTLNVSDGDCAVAGDTIEYTFTVTNQANEILSAIVVTDLLVPVITYVSGDTNGDLLLDVTETWIYTGTYILVQADIVAGLVTNQATVVGTQPDGTSVTDFSDDNSVLENDPTVNYTCPIAIVKEGTLNVSDGDCAVAGDTIEYTFTVTNQANEILSAIVVTDLLVPVITYVSGDTNGDLLLDVTETWIYTGTYILVQADIVAGLVTNQATVVGTQPDGTSVTDFSDDNSVLENDPTVNYTCPIAIVKEGTLNVSDGDCAVAGDTIEYTFTVTNQANEILSAIVVTDLLVPVITYVSGDTNGDLLLDVTETWIYTGTYILVQADIVAGLVTNQATVVGTQPDGTSVTDFSDDNSVLENDPTVNYTCPIAIVKEGTLNVSDGDCAVAGDTIEYTFTVTNQANEILSAIVVTDLLVPVITYVSGDTNGDLLLDVTETWIYTGTYILVQADIVAGQVTNQATVVGTQPDGTSVTDFSDDNSVLENDPTVNYTCPIAIVKEGTLNVSDGDCAVAGDTIEYTFIVTNQSNEILSAIVVTDLLVPVITYVLGDTNGDLLLDVTETWIYTGTYILVQADIVAGQVTNQATVVGTQPDGTSVTDFSDDNSVLENDPTLTILCPNSMSLIKNQTSPAGGLGDTLTYDIVVTNTGTTILTDIEITDANAVITGGNPIASLLPGASATVTAVHEITQGDIDLGYIENIAMGLGDSPDGTDDVSDDSDAGTDVNGDPILDPEGTETPDGDGTTNGDPTDDPTVTVIEQASSMSLIKNQTSPAGGLGDTLTYDIVVTNTGTTILTDIEITDANAVITGGNPIASLLPGASATVTAAHEITQDDIDLGYVENIAIGLGDSPDGTDDVGDDSDAGTDVNGDPILDPEGTETPDGDGTTNGDPTDDPTVTVIGQIGQNTSSMSLIKNQTSSAGGLGDTLTYDIVVTNTGTTILTDIEITDANAVITGGNPIASLLPGESVTITAAHEITQDDIDLGYVENIAIGLGDSPDGTDDVGDDSDAGTDVNGDPILDPEGTETPDGDGTTNGDPTDDPTVTVIGQDPSSMSLIKNQTSSAGGLGDTLTYDIVVTNTGTTILTDIVITDANAVITGGNPIASLLPGESVTITAAHEITQDDIDLGYVENIAIGLGDSPDGTDDVGDDSDAGTDVNGDPILDPEGTETPDGDGTTNGDPTDDPTITVIEQASSMSLIKNQTSQEVELGDTLTYEIVVTNTGNTTLTDIEITDANAVITGGFVNPIESLMPGASVTITAEHEITQGDIDLTYVENIAMGLGDSPNGTDDVGDDSDAGTDINGNPILDSETVETPNGDGSTNQDPTDDPTITGLSGIEGAQLIIYNVVTPNNDGAHDYFQVLGIQEWPNNNMKIYNRWGVLVFETDGYGGSDGKENVFTGISDGRVTVKETDELPTGTYFYVLTLLENELESPEGKNNYSGYLYINR